MPPLTHILSRPITAQDCISAIVTAEGSLDVAAERVFGVAQPGQINPKAQLIATLAEDPHAFKDLQRQLRTLALLQAYSSTRLVGVVVDGTLASQEPKDLVKLYASLMSSVAELTDDKSTTNTNINANVDVPSELFKLLPPDVREAVRVLQDSSFLPPALDAPTIIDQEAPSPLPLEAGVQGDFGIDEFIDNASEDMSDEELIDALRHAYPEKHIIEIGGKRRG